MGACVCAMCIHVGMCIRFIWHCHVCILYFFHVHLFHMTLSFVYFVFLSRSFVHAVSERTQRISRSWLDSFLPTQSSTRRKLMSAFLLLLFYFITGNIDSCFPLRLPPHFLVVNGNCISLKISLVMCTEAIFSVFRDMNVKLIKYVSWKNYWSISWTMPSQWHCCVCNIILA